MKICFVNSLDYSQGSTYRARHLAMGLAKLGHSVIYLESTPSFHMKIDCFQGVKKIFVPQPRNICGFLFGTLIRILFTLIENYDVLIVQKCLPLTVPCLLNAVLRGKICILDWDDYDTGYQPEGFRKRVIHFFEHYFPSFFDAVVTHSHFLMKMSEKLGVKTSRICMVPQGVDTSLFKPSKSYSLKDRKTLGLLPGDKVLVFLGTFSFGGSYDFDPLIEAVIQVHHKTPIKFLVIGGGPLLNFYKLSIQRRGLANNTIFTDIQPHERIPALINTGDICLLYMRPSISNKIRSSLKLLEYWSMAKPVVCHVVGENELIVNPNRAILAPADPKGFAEAIEYALKHPELCRQIGYAGREFVVQQRDWKTIVKHFERFLYGVRKGV